MSLVSATATPRAEREGGPLAKRARVTRATRGPMAGLMTWFQVTCPKCTGALQVRLPEGVTSVQCSQCKAQCKNSLPPQIRPWMLGTGFGPVVWCAWHCLWVCIRLHWACVLVCGDGVTVIVFACVYVYFSMCSMHFMHALTFVLVCLFSTCFVSFCFSFFNQGSICST